MTFTAMAISVGIRGAFLGFENSAGLSATYFPVFLGVTLYAGARWGGLALAATLALGVLNPSLPMAGVSLEGIILLYAASGAVTVLFAAILRDALIRLDEAEQQRRTAENALGQTVAQLQLAQEAGHVGLYDWDLVKAEGTWSATVYRNLGLDPATKPSIETILSVMHPEDRGLIGTPDSAGLTVTEYRVVWPDGSIHWLLSRGQVIHDEVGRPLRAIGVNLDITERRLAYEKIAESEARFRTLANSAPVLMWVTHQNGAREFVNQVYVDYLGLSYEEALTFDWRKRLHPEDHDRILAEQAAGEASRKMFSLEARYRRADGIDRWIRSISRPRSGPSGEHAGFIGVGIDITDAKRAEDDLKHINDLLAERVQAALADRDKAEAALHRALKLEAVGQLTGGVAHDFNNLLTVIIGALDLIQRHPNDGARRERMVEAALGAAKRGERLTHQLLAFARRQNLKPELVRVDDMLRDSAPLLHRAVGEAVNLTLSPGAPGVVTRIDPSQFEAAVMNLVVNARDAVTSGGVIRVESLRCTLGAGEVEETPPGEYLCVAVHDTGVGMDANTMSRVFEPFFTTKEVGKGTGLGLSQIYGFARQSGGGVSIDSAPGKGASVRIYLPIAAEEATVAPEEPPAPTPRANALDVLLVEDDLAVGDMITAMLEEAGHRVQRAEEADAALTILRRAQPVDLLLTDVVMPGALSGVDLARQAVMLRPALPVILSSGYTGETLNSAAEAPWPLLRKPYSSEDLVRTIEQLINPEPEVV